MRSDDPDDSNDSDDRERAGEMKIGMVGLGKMGANMTQRLIAKGHHVVAFDLSDEARAAVASKGAETAATLAEMVAKLDPPRVAWVMVPAGAPTTSTIDTLKGLMQRGDAVIDGGNSNYKEAGCGASPTVTASWWAATRRSWRSASRCSWHLLPKAATRTWVQWEPGIS
jgi:hypothetical protein